MSFIGNILGGYGASQLGRYNQSVANAQARVDAAKAEVRKNSNCQKHLICRN